MPLSSSANRTRRDKALVTGTSPHAQEDASGLPQGKVDFIAPVKSIEGSFEDPEAKSMALNVKGRRQFGPQMF